jgi:hypothetical protein
MGCKVPAVIVLTTALLIFTGPLSFGQLRRQSEDAIKRGLEFLAANQRETGGFATYRWTTDNSQRTKQIDTSFTVSQVLYSVTFCGDTTISRGIKERAASYLITQREPPGVWRYYGKTGRDRISPDVDTTAMAWAALARSGYSIPATAFKAIRDNRNEAGLFNTWIGDPSTWIGIDSRDIDVVVNLNALLFFGLAHENIAAVCNYALAQAKSERFRRGSVNYSSPLAFTHAFSRAYADGGVRCLENAVPKIRDATLSLQQSNGGWGDDLETAFGALTLLNVGFRGEPLERGINVILSRQTSDGGWALTPAYRAAVSHLRYGSRSITTAVCLEALAKYLKR